MAVKKKKNKYKYVEVNWKDAISDSGWIERKSLPLPAVIVSRGWLVVDHDEYITLAGSLGDDTDEKEDFGEVITIPKGWTTNIKKLKVPA